MDKFVKKRKRNTSESTEVENENKKPRIRVNESSEDPSQTETDREVRVQWRKIIAEMLDCSYTILYGRTEADSLLENCERTLTYNTGDQAKVRVFGKWTNIPRKQVAHGDTGLQYSFSGTTVPARPWTPFLENIRQKIEKITGYKFNFVLINRYKDGMDHIGEHRDDEVDLSPGFPIASLSLGQERDFVFRHADSRGKNCSRKIDPVKIELQHGSLLLMNHPTKTYWYHSLPPRKRLKGVRISMTFRRMRIKSSNSAHLADS